MGTVLTVQAKINGDATSIVAAAAKGRKAVKDMQTAAQEANAGFQGLGEGIGKAVRVGVDGIGRLITATVKVGAAAVTAAAVAGGAFAFKAAQAGLDRLEAIQDSTVALTRMLGSAAAAAALTQKALAVVQGTPFAFPQFAEATRTLVAFGVQAGKVPGVLQAIADSAAASGRGTDAVDGLTQAFANLQVQGKVSSDILQQLGTSGVNGLGILANAFGKSTSDMQDMISQGLVPADKAMDILVDGIEHGSHGIAGDFNSLAGAAQDLGQTVSGSLGNVKAAFARMGASWLKPFTDDLPRVLNGGVIPLLDKLGAAGQKVFQKLAGTGILDKALSAFQSLTRAVDPTIQTFLGLVNALSPLKVVFDALKAVMPSVQDALSTTGRRVAGQLVPAIADLFKALVPLLPIIAQIVSAFARGLTTAIPTVTSMISGLMPVLSGFVGLLTSLPSPVLAVGVALLGLSKAGVPVGDMITKFFQLGGAFQNASAGVEGFAGKFGAASDKMGGLKATMGGLASFMSGPWGIAIGAAVTVIGLIATSIGPSQEAVDNYTASLDRNTGAFTKNTDAAVLAELQKTRAVKAAKELGVSVADLVKAAEGDTAAQKRVAEATKASVDAAEALSRKNRDATGWEAAKNNANTVTQALGVQSQAIKNAIADNQDWLTATGAAKTAQEGVKTALDTYSAALSANTVNTDVNSSAYKANLTALNTLGSQAVSYIDTVHNQTGSVNATTAAQGSMIKALMASAQQMGMSRDQATQYIAKLLGIPERRVTELVVNTGDALARIASVNAAFNRLQAQANAGINIMVKAGGPAIAQENGGMWSRGVQAFANGGMRAYASGGLESGIYAARNPGIIKFAEPQTKWEAYISGKPGQRDRNIGIAMDALKKLGVDPSAMGGGGNSLSITNHLHGVDPQVTVDLLEQDIMAKLGW